LQSSCLSRASALSSSIKPTGSALSRRTQERVSKRISRAASQSTASRPPWCSAVWRSLLFDLPWISVSYLIRSERRGLIEPCYGNRVTREGRSRLHIGVVVYRCHKFHERGADCFVELADLRCLQDVCQADCYVCGDGADLAFRNRSLRFSPHCQGPSSPHTYLSGHVILGSLYELSD